jgi:hypothetical protein
VGWPRPLLADSATERRFDCEPRHFEDRGSLGA